MGEEIAITFETLYDILMREKQRDELLQLEPTFFQDVITYLREKMKVWETVSKDNDLFSLGERDKVEGEIKNIRKVLKDWYERREKKIIEVAVNKSRTGQGLDASNMLEEERQLLQSLVDVLNRSRHGILLNLLKMELPHVEEAKVIVKLTGEEPEQKPKQTVMVRFINPVPKFVGSDLAVYGPFDEDDVAGLPADVAHILIQKKRAEEIKKDGS